MEGENVTIRRVNLGCAYTKIDGFINVDFNPQCEPDILHDLRKGLPFDINSVDEIRADDFLEHMPDFVSTMNEIGRVLKSGGILKARFPFFLNEGAFSVAHAKVLTVEDFWCFTPTYTKNFEYSITGEKLDKGFRMIEFGTTEEKTECSFWCGVEHPTKKTHVVMEKI